MFEWLTPAPAPTPRPPAPRRACWGMDCDREAAAVVGRLVPGLPPDAELCGDCDVVLEFNLAGPEVHDLKYLSSADARGTELSGWMVGGLFLVRPPA